MSKIYDHRVVVLRLRFSDSGKQSDMSNETQEAEIQKWLTAVSHKPHIPFVIRHEHSAYDPDALRLDEDLARIKRYNRGNPNPITLLLHYDTSRFIRNSAEGNYWRYIFKKEGVEINTSSNWLDFDDANGNLYVQFEQHQAEQYSRSVSKNIIRANAGWRSSGYNPHNMSRLYFAVENAGTRERRNVWLPSKANLSQSIDLILTGSTIKHAYEATGGREVHGHINTFSGNIRKEYMMARRGVDTFAYPPVTSEFKWQRLQKKLKSNRVLTRGEKALAKAWLTGVILSDGCNRRVSRSTTKKNGKENGKYYICPCKPVRHYRTRREPMEAAMLEALGELALTADRQKQLSGKAEARAKKQLDRLKKDARRLTKQHAEAEELVVAAKKKYILDKITEDDFKECQSEMLIAKAKLGETETQIAKYGEIVAAVKASIADIGTFLVNHADKLQLRDFVMMLFPDGLHYDAKKRQFRTTQINAVYSLIAQESVSYSRIKIGVPINLMDTPGMGRMSVLSRTPQSDIRLFRDYLDRYKTA